MNILWVILLVFISLSVSAERYEEAVQQYDRGDYEKSLSSFKGLALLGNKDAQYAIGAIYSRGDGVKKNNLTAWAWMNLASTKEKKEYLAARDKVELRLNEGERQAAYKYFLELEKEYGDVVVEHRLYPNFGGSSKKFRPERLIRRSDLVFPAKGRIKKTPGSVMLEYMVGKDGRTRFHRVINYTNDYFVAPSLKVAKKMLYKPAISGGDPINLYAVKYRFSFAFYSGTDEIALVKSLEEFRDKALTGTSVDRFNYAYNLTVSNPFLSINNKQKFGNANLWNFKAAVDGHALAKFALGSSLLYGKQCSADSTKSYFWLKSAAEDGVPDAQMLLGLERYYGEFLEKNEMEGISWLLKAAESGNDIARLRYAQIIALSPNFDKASVARARELVDVIGYKGFYDRLSYHEINALLYSVEGKFDLALKQQKKAVKFAKKIDIDLDLLRANLKFLKEGKRITKIVEIG